MKIYIASSWKNETNCLLIAKLLRKAGHEVDCFCDESSGRYVFHWTEMVKREEDLNKYDAIDFLWRTGPQKAFNEDKKWLDWAECCLLVLPSGRSAHLEAGYAKGQGKKLYVLGDFPKGEFEVMYGFADGLYRFLEFESLKQALH